MSADSFKKFSLHPAILRALVEKGYQEPTPVQAAAIPLVLEGKDLLATAQTGTGKTAAFALPILHMLHKRKKSGAPAIRALVLAPTRELALQVEENFRAYGRFLPLRVVAVIGGSPTASQIKALGKTPHILVATPGRLLDLYGQGFITLDDVETLVLDEADRMLDMGFMPDVYRILSYLPDDRQTILCSATIPLEVGDLAAQMLRDPVRVNVAPPDALADNIEQKVLFVPQGNKHHIIVGLLRKENIRKALIFTRTKRRADRLSQQLSDEGIPADAIHSSKTQNARQEALAAFEGGRIEVLVGTDLVARGIDVDGISHVINYDLPDEPGNYVHRVGRTARAGASGVAFSLCYPRELEMLRDIEQLTRSTLIAVEEEPYYPPNFSAEDAARREGKRSHTVATACGAVSSPKPETVSAPAPETRYGRRPVRRLAR